MKQPSRRWWRKREEEVEEEIEKKIENEMQKQMRDQMEKEIEEEMEDREKRGNFDFDDIFDNGYSEVANS